MSLLILFAGGGEAVAVVFGGPVLSKTTADDNYLSKATADDSYSSKVTADDDYGAKII